MKVAKHCSQKSLFFKKQEASTKEWQEHVRRLAEGTQTISVMTERGMRRMEMRFKRQAGRNLSLTEIKVSNLINSMARTGRGRSEVWPQVKKKKRSKQERKGPSGTLMLSVLLSSHRYPLLWTASLWAHLTPSKPPQPLWNLHLQ